MLGWGKRSISHLNTRWSPPQGKANRRLLRTLCAKRPRGALAAERVRRAKLENYFVAPPVVVVVVAAGGQPVRAVAAIIAAKTMKITFFIW